LADTVTAWFEYYNSYNNSIYQSNMQTPELWLRELLNIQEEDQHTPQSARNQLNALIGLKNVKTVINKITENFKMAAARQKFGLSSPNSCMHMVFSGSPGTAKTTVARLLAHDLAPKNCTSMKVSKKMIN
jgi:Holliday junction resolvasome RuvABC ATP-dependent DNA helicase subunit